MGNRAVITTKENWKSGGIGVYLHWNGGRDSVQAFLKYCELKGYREPSTDSYGWARLCQVIANFFGGSDSIGIDTLWRLDCDNYDNGVYIIDGWEIDDRAYFNGNEQTHYDLDEMLLAINEAQPAKEQISNFLNGEERDIKDIKVGDRIVYMDYFGHENFGEIIGIGKDEFINGHNVKGVPYFKTSLIDNPENNINCYLSQYKYFRVESEE